MRLPSLRLDYRLRLASSPPQPQNLKHLWSSKPISRYYQRILSVQKYGHRSRGRVECSFRLPFRQHLLRLHRSKRLFRHRWLRFTCGLPIWPVDTWRGSTYLKAWRWPPKSLRHHSIGRRDSHRSTNAEKWRTLLERSCSNVKELAHCSQSPTVPNE